MDIHRTINRVNVSLLDEELRAGLPGALLGVSWRRPHLRIHLIDAASEQDIQVALDILEAHDIDGESQDQRRRRLHRARLLQARSGVNGVTLDPEVMTGNERDLALLVIWLAEELRALRYRIGQLE